MTCLMESEKAGSGMAFFKKVNIDLSKAARWGRHCTPGRGAVMTRVGGEGGREGILM